MDENLKKAASLGLLQDHPHAHEALESATVHDATTNADALPLDTAKGVLTDVLRRGATPLLGQAIQAEVAAYLDAHAHLREEAGRQQGARNGSLPQRTLLTGIGPVEGKQPRLRRLPDTLGGRRRACCGRVSAWAANRRGP